MHFDTYQTWHLEYKCRIWLIESQKEDVPGRRKSQIIWYLPKYLLCSNGNKTLALACAWRGVGNDIKQFEENQQKKYKRMIQEQSDVFPGTCYVLMIKKH